MKRWKQVLYVICLILLIIYMAEKITSIYIDWLWFEEIGYPQILFITLSFKIITGLVMGALFFFILYINLYIIKKLSPRLVRFSQSNLIEIFDSGFFNDRSYKLMIIIVFLFSLIIAFKDSDIRWQLITGMWYGVPFNISEPVFRNDLSFYIFRLPLYTYLISWIKSIFIIIFVFTVLIYLFYKMIRFDTGKILALSNRANLHLSTLAFFIFGIISIQYYLERYYLLYSSRGVINGAGYTDINAALPALTIMAIAAGLYAISLLVNLKLKSSRLPLIGLLVYIVLSVVVRVIYPPLIQQFEVLPNEFSKEKIYIKTNIEYTLKAYGLDKIDIKEFPADETLNMEYIQENRATIDNIRLWDDKLLLNTYAQLQEIKRYYEVVDVDVDRYVIDGEYRQVMLSARELSYDRLNTDEWINQHITYTHGFGLCLSPVNRVSKEGLPEFFIKDIPPVFTGDLKIDRPEIYYGEISKNYSIVKTRNNEDGTPQEFDYPSGSSNKYCVYEGSGGIKLSGFFRKLIFARYLGSLKLLLNKDMTDESRLLIHRKISERLEKAFPLLIYSGDPYVVISEGKLYWICDAYTISNRYPYSTPQKFQGKYNINYIRNPVKAVIDAYNGKVDFYISEKEDVDPLIQTYTKIFPGVFKDFSEMPENIKKHIRYPQELFNMQSKIYCTYHMEDAQVFYNKEDLWNIPREIFASEEQEMEPYYTIMTISEEGGSSAEGSNEFILMTPFTPQNKNNLSAWICARCDGENYGKLLLFLFPKKKLVYGPMQIEARINQDTEISKQLSLWNQEGSEVMRGNLLVIPVQNSLLYVEPLYLKAEKVQLPELKKIILVYGSQIAMENTLEEAIIKVFGEEIGEERTEEGENKNKTVKEMAREALKLYGKAQENVKKGDWAGYGEEMKKLELLLNKIAEKDEPEKETREDESSEKNTDKDNIEKQKENIDL